MARHRFIEAIRPVRGNPLVADRAEALVLTMDAHAGTVDDVGGSERVSIRDAPREFEAITCHEPWGKPEEAQVGDRRHPFADTTKSVPYLGWKPRVDREEGWKRPRFRQREVK